MLLIIIIYTIYSYQYLIEEEKIKFHCGYDYDELDIVINSNSFNRIWIYGLISGFLAGALGSGGGYISGHTSAGPGMPFSRGFRHYGT